MKAQTGKLRERMVPTQEEVDELFCHTGVVAEAAKAVCRQAATSTFEVLRYYLLMWNKATQVSVELNFSLSVDMKNINWCECEIYYPITDNNWATCESQSLLLIFPGTVVQSRNHLSGQTFTQTPFFSLETFFFLLRLLLSSHENNTEVILKQENNKENLGK